MRQVLQWLSAGRFYIGAVAQLVRVPACRAGCCGFESHQPRSKWLVYIDLWGRGPARRDVKRYGVTTYNYFDYFCIFICRTQCDRKRGHSDSQRKFPKFIKEFL